MVPVQQLLRDMRRWERLLRDPRHLQHYEYSVSSQNGEDGMIAEALTRMGIAQPTFVELGASDGRENCTRNLLEIGGSGLWLEGDSVLVERARLENSNKSVEIVCAFLTVDNIVDLIESSKVAVGFDVLVVDIDGNDWWLAERVLEKWHPSLVVTEYNPSRGPSEKWVMPYDAAHEWQRDDMYGASLGAFERLMNRNGYALVACDSRAVNAFWVDKSRTKLFTDKPVARHQFVPALPGSRHRRHREPTVDFQVDIDKVSIGPHRVRSVRGCSRELHTIVVRNDSDSNICSFGELPIRVGITSGSESEPVRMSIDVSISPGSTGTAEVVLPPGVRFSSAAVVQEGVRWGQFTDLDT